MKKNILLVGETSVSNSIHYKGWEEFITTNYHFEAEELINSIDNTLFDIDYLKGHEASEYFPCNIDSIKKYSAIIFSDIGSNSILLHPKVWRKGETYPNRLQLVKEYVEIGGSFLMVGGYLSYQGINGSARYKNTPIEEILPVEIKPYDDRIEIPQGFRINIENEEHEILNGLKGNWPPLLGLNEVVASKGSQTIVSIPKELGSHPLLVTGKHGLGKTMAWTSDIGLHWVSQEFLLWPGYKKLWNQIFSWLVKE